MHHEQSAMRRILGRCPMANRRVRIRACKTSASAHGGQSSGKPPFLVGTDLRILCIPGRIDTAQLARSWAYLRSTRGDMPPRAQPSRMSISPPLYHEKRNSRCDHGEQQDTASSSNSNDDNPVGENATAFIICCCCLRILRVRVFIFH